MTYGHVGQSNKLIKAGFIFPKRHKRGENTFYVRANSIRSAWTSACMKAGFTPGEYRFHDIRRSWAHYAELRGVPDRYRALILGHSVDVQNTNYATAADLEKLSELLGSSICDPDDDKNESSNSNSVPNLFQSKITA